MRFQRDGFSVFSWETDEHGNKIPGSEEHANITKPGAGRYSAYGNHINPMMEDRAKRTPKDRFVVAEVWEVDSRRPDMQYFSTYQWQGTHPVSGGTADIL